MTPATAEVAAASPEIARALRDAFGDAPVDDLAVMTGGRSGATLLSLAVEGKGYVLRRRDPARPGNELRTAREIGCMRIASERGVAPRLRHVDGASGVTIMEKVEVAPCARRTECVATTLRRLHEGPAFPTGKATTVTAMAHFADEVLRARGGDGLPEDLLRTMDELATATKHHGETAPCHNDLNPGNILTTHDAAVFIDWEISGQGDPFFDLGQLGVFMFRTPGARAELLEAYLGRIPSEEEHARAFVARVMALGFFSASFFHHVAIGKGRGPATPVPMPELLGLLATNRASPEVVAVSLLEEMRQEKEKLASM